MEYDTNMAQVINRSIKKFNSKNEKVSRKGFWLFKRHIKEIKIYARNHWDNNESALMRHILDNWFGK